MIPSPHTIHYITRTTGGVDGMGNPEVSWSDPVPWRVHGYHQGPSPENIQLGREASSVAMTVYAPTAPFDGTSRVVIGDETLEVIGDPADWRHGPWANPVAGFVVELRRKEG